MLLTIFTLIYEHSFATDSTNISHNLLNDNAVNFIIRI